MNLNSSLFLYLVTPTLGCLRNYVKYKQLKLLLFLRTPITYYFIKTLFKINNVWQVLVFERWYFFIYKTLLSLYNNDYKVKKDKYVKKYGLKYS